MAALASYRGLWSVTGPGFLLLAFLARLPAAMGVVGALTLVVTTTDSLTAAGIAAGALGVGSALGGPVVGSLADRYGQRLVGVAAALIDALAYAALLYSALSHAPLAVTAGAAALAGFATPQVGPLVRVRWAALLGDLPPGPNGRTARPGARTVAERQRLMPTAMSYEGTADETAYITGPALVGVLALTGHPTLPLIGAIALLVVAGTLFAVHPTAPPVLRVPSDAPRDRLTPDLWGLVAAMVFIGVVFGATQTGITALARDIGETGAGGLVYAVMGVGSIVAGLLTAALPTRFRVSLRYVVFAVALFVGAAPLLLVDSLGSAMAALAFLGVAVAPYLITGYVLAERITVARRAGAAMTLMASGAVAGNAVGSALSGVLADRYGYQGAFTVPVVAGLLAVLLAATTAPRLRRVLATLPPSPTPATALPTAVPAARR
ncbi:MFS transporter [Longispora fulva]|uniref:MFS family permease n=1 Tax=Longispora fulva TaxID=619741 RepID=A0A8J7H452_9ACTN|nr:MFS transporter [Longispora fulva]MBG6141028.1 MFS family permease [Longispora fulva]GIG60702.1 MFS transporter [Longispora fulva]